MFLHKMLNSHQFLETISKLSLESDIILIAAPNGIVLIGTNNISCFFFFFYIEH